MPRMSKKRKQEWSFFLNDRNRITYNQLCRKCIHECKQSFRAVVVECPHYCSKRSKTGHGIALSAMQKAIGLDDRRIYDCILNNNENGGN